MNNRRAIILSIEKTKIKELSDKQIVYLGRNIFYHEKYTIGKRDWVNGYHKNTYGYDSYINNYIFLYTVKFLP